MQIEVNKAWDKMNGKLKVGILGCGGIATQNHIPVWLRLKDIELVAVCDKSEERAKNTANKFRIPECYTDFSEMLEKEQLDIIDNCTPVQLHAPLSIQAMEAGCHVIVSKPMAMNERDANEMIRVAKKNNVWLYPIHNTLFNPIMEDIKSLIRNGYLGDIVGMDVTYLKKRDDSGVVNKDHWSHKLPGGIFGEILAHPIYLELAILGKLDILSVHTEKFLPYEWIKADELRVTLKGERGIGRIMISLNSPKNSALVKIYGTKMILDVNLWCLTLIKHKPMGYSIFSLGRDSLSQSLQQFKGTINVFIKTIRGKALPGHYILIPNFVNVIRNNEKPLVTAEEGKEVARVLEKITKQIDESDGLDDRH